MYNANNELSYVTPKQFQFKIQTKVSGKYFKHSQRRNIKDCKPFKSYNVTNIRSLNTLNQSDIKSFRNKEGKVFTSVRDSISTSSYTMDTSVISNVINNNTNRSDFSVSPQVCHILQYDRICKWYIYSAICAYTIGYGNNRPITDSGKV